MKNIFTKIAFVSLLLGTISCNQKETPTTASSEPQIEYNHWGMVQSYANIKNGQAHGLYMELNNRGDLIKQYNYQHGELDGKQFHFSRNGSRELIVSYKNGVKDGDYTKYYNGGVRIQEHCVYKNGEKHGKALWYFDDKDQTLSTVFHYNNGKLHGVAEKYYPSGNIKAKANYTNGSLDGDWKNFEDKKANE
ncbi:MAG: hypothetical protein N4A45_11735 [Flavobacteriales bacterium]|jgi:antitoxin component YwqK of YwqJK toxin-antitoxin module|nr:hypothetical protein [Flavobacteriales bacterium]